ncbi:hypothetical protein OS493_032300 [Desmophyllum pertusum]|uniref:ABC transporter domain-containing protein n=1 Tax=Desmophyllum pertusum TaxID=174260 RepID=A0A9X0CP14_9CNID|nr:hypothetical protein OS493_032300 [Desmophyllum pertusum]
MPWVFSGTVRENILFGLPFNKEKFQHVDICGLTKDLTDFTNGDLKEIGQRGATLSGGQKARVGLARAMYSDADIYLLDDPLSAVDTKVGRKLFDSCIVGHLSGRIRLLVTHRLQHLKDLDHIVVMENGSINHQGVYKELTEQGVFSDILELSPLFQDDPGRVRSASLYEFNEKGDIMMVMNRPRSITTVSVLNRPRSITTVSALRGHFLELPDLQEDILPTPRIRLIAGNVSPKHSRSVSLYEFTEKEIINKVMHRPSFISVSYLNGHRHEGKDNLAFVNDFELPKLQENDCGGVSNTKDDSNPQIACTSVSEADQRPVIDMKEEEESKMTGTVTWRLYWDYFKEGLSVPMIVLLAVSLISAQVCLIVPNWYQDENTKHYFMVVSCNRWLSIRLELLSSLFVTIVAVAAILIVENPALAGLALTYALQTLDCTQYSLRLASEVENLMTSVERVMSYTQIESEPGYATESHPSGSYMFVLRLIEVFLRI